MHKEEESKKKELSFSTEESRGIRMRATNGGRRGRRAGKRVGKDEDLRGNSSNIGKALK